MTLTQTAILTKQIITISIIALIVGILSFTGYKIWYAYYLSTLPPVEEKPDTKFGILPSPLFPKPKVSSSNFSYELDTKTGGLPKIGVDKGFEKMIKVYFILKTYATFLSPDRSRALAEKFNISNPPNILNETVYNYTQADKLLTVDLDSGNFEYSKKMPASSEALSPDETLVAGFTGMLSNLGVFKDELRGGRTNVETFKNGETNFAQVSIWPKDINDKPILTSDINRSDIFATIIKSSENIENYLMFNFTHYQIDTSTFATYYMKSPDDAFNDLKGGKGAIILVPDKPQASITNVYLGYFLPEKYTPYLQPIFIFEGPQFVGYVSAIPDEFQKSQ